MASVVEGSAGLSPLGVATATERAISSDQHSQPSARDCKPAPSSLPRWEAIPGISRTRAELEEALLWPILYGDRFGGAARTKEEEGVVLVGPSGVGKSMLVRSLVEYLRERLPSASVQRVAGPSLLGKYVGSSEAAVRKLFAQIRRRPPPRLLVFEELEALAPRRGTDNTGTTDRVVNQLLTELDGVEGRGGVYVLAVTSRLDLVDPAILRPGRLGTHISMRAPSVSERLEILQYYAPESMARDQVLLEQVALGTEGWTGADLRGLWERALEGQAPQTSDEAPRPPVDPDALLSQLVELQEEQRSQRILRPAVPKPRVTLA